MRNILLGIACLIFGLLSPAGVAAHEPGTRVGTAAALYSFPKIECGAECAVEEPDAPARVRARFSPPAWVARAIAQASAASGVDHDYMLRAAALESSFDPFKEVGTSSAKGLYQFIEHTWFYMLREIGSEYGLQDLADAIAADNEGRFAVADEGARKVILWLRNDPWLSAAFAAAYTRRNADWLARALGRAAAPSELYLAHVLGATGAAELIGLAVSAPRTDACKKFARAARANRTIFYNGKKPRTIQEVHDVLVNKYFDIPVDALTPEPWQMHPGTQEAPVLAPGEFSLIQTAL
jgi:hypothetical protein